MLCSNHSNHLSPCKEFQIQQIVQDHSQEAGFWTAHQNFFLLAPIVTEKFRSEKWEKKNILKHKVQAAPRSVTFFDRSKNRHEFGKSLFLIVHQILWQSVHWKLRYSYPSSTLSRILVVSTIYSLALPCSAIIITSRKCSALLDIYCWNVDSCVAAFVHATIWAPLFIRQRCTYGFSFYNNRLSDEKTGWDYLKYSFTFKPKKPVFQIINFMQKCQMQQKMWDHSQKSTTFFLTVWATVSPNYNNLHILSKNYETCIYFAELKLYHWNERT